MTVPFLEMYLNSASGLNKGCVVIVSRMHCCTCSPFATVRSKTESLSKICCDSYLLMLRYYNIKINANFYQKYQYLESARFTRVMYPDRFTFSFIF